MMGLDSGRTAEIVVAAAAILAVAFAGGTMTEVGEWYESLNFPRLRPPNWLFAPAWTTIYLLTAAGAIIGWEHAKGLEGRSRLIALFVVNGVLNVLWSPLFFKLRRPDWALYELLRFLALRPRPRHRIVAPVEPCGVARCSVPRLGNLRRLAELACRPIEQTV